MNTINFTARLLQKTPILKMDSKENYEPCDISIVELDKDNYKDVNAMYKTAQSWLMQGGGYLASNIYNDAVKSNQFNNAVKEHYYAATVQDSDYENLDSKKILGLSLFSEMEDKMESRNEIVYFEVKPITSKSLSGYREYKKVGSAILNYLQNTFTKKPIYVVSATESIDFYKKNNFKPIDNYKDCPFLIYNKEL